MELLEERMEAVKKRINDLENGGNTYYEKKLKKVKACKSSIKNILSFCPEVEYMDDVELSDFQRVKEAAIVFLQARMADEQKYAVLTLEKYKKELNLLKQFSEIKRKERLEISKSPYSNSFYLHKKGEEIGWYEKPEGSYRLSNHWSFDGHCESDDIKNSEIAIGKYIDGKYVKITE